ncbi:hypothetical protein pdam_00021455, partial [Pocillopora damicornis]
SPVCEYLDHLASLRRTKVTRPLAPWLKEFYTQQLQEECETLCNKTRTLHQNPQPLGSDAGKLNAHYVSTQGVWPAPPLRLWIISFNLIESIADNKRGAFTLNPVFRHEVFLEQKKRRSLCSCTPDGIPVEFIKIEAFSTTAFSEGLPICWKVACIRALLNFSQKVKGDIDLRPISILPVLSMIYNRLVLFQMENSCLVVLPLYQRTLYLLINTATALLAMKDAIGYAIKRCEVTMTVQAEFSNSYDTVAYETVLNKLYHPSFLRWVTDYLAGRKQFTEIDDRASKLGVPLCGVLGPVMLLSTPQLARVHKLEDFQGNLVASGQLLERVSNTRLLGTEIH